MYSAAIHLTVYRLIDLSTSETSMGTQGLCILIELDTSPLLSELPCPDLILMILSENA